MCWNLEDEEHNVHVDLSHGRGKERWRLSEDTAWEDTQQRGSGETPKGFKHSVMLSEVLERLCCKRGNRRETG